MAFSIYVNKSHSAGHLCLAYEEQLGCVISGGNDNEIKVWDGFTDKLKFSYHMSGPINALISETDRVFAACNNNTVETLSVFHRHQSTSVGHFAGTLTDLSLTKDGSQLSICSDTGGIKVLNLNETSRERFSGVFEVILCQEGTAVQSVAINYWENPGITLVAVVNNDGSVIIWSVEKRSPLQKLPAYERDKVDRRINQCRVKWHPEKPAILAFPRKHEIELVDCTDQDRDSTQSTFSIIGRCGWDAVSKGTVTDLAFSRNGNWLVAGMTDGYLCMWNLLSRQLISSWRSDRSESISSVAWVREDNAESIVIFGDIVGCWEALRFELGSLVKDDDNDHLVGRYTVDDEQINMCSNLGDLCVDLDASDFCQNENDTDQFDDKFTNNGHGNLDEDNFESCSRAPLSSSDGDDNGIDNEDLIEDYHDGLETEFRTQKEKVEDANSDSNSTSEARASDDGDDTEVDWESFQLRWHEPLRSTRCPRSGEQQLLTWNSVGTVVDRGHDLLVRFCDAGDIDGDGSDETVRTVSILDDEEKNTRYGHLADVNQWAVLVATCPMLREEEERHFSEDDINDGVDCHDNNDELDEDDESSTGRAEIFVEAIEGTWENWKILLPPKEHVIDCCLLGNEYAVVLTDTLLHYFRLDGNGLEINTESVPGYPVAINSWKRDKRSQALTMEAELMVIVIETENQLMWRLDSFKPNHLATFTILADVVSTDWELLPLSDGASLTWIGFSDGRSLHTVDSCQVARRLLIDFTFSGDFSTPRWVPVIDFQLATEETRQGINQYLPVAFYDTGDRCFAAAARCSELRCPILESNEEGGDEHKDWWRSIDRVPYQIPVCCPGDETNDLEGSMILNDMMTDWSTNYEERLLTRKQLLLQLFANAVLSSATTDYRAFSIAQMMPDSQLIQLAIRFAVRNNKRNLAERLGELALEKDREVERQNLETDTGTESYCDSEEVIEDKDNPDQESSMTTESRSGGESVKSELSGSDNEDDLKGSDNADDSNGSANEDELSGSVQEDESSEIDDVLDRHHQLARQPSTVKRSQGQLSPIDNAPPGKLLRK